MLAAFKNLSLYGFYIAGALFIIMALLGKIKLPFFLTVMLLPLRNVVERLHPLPLGKDFIDILLVSMLIGWIFRSIAEKDKFWERSPLNGLLIIMVLYTFFSVIHGFAYLRYESNFNITDTRFQDWKNFCILPFLFFLTFNNAKDKKWILNTVVVMCFAIVLMDSYLIQQLLWYSSIESRTKVTGTFVFLGPNEIAAFYNMYTVILTGIFLFTKRKLLKLFLLGIICVNIFCILFLFSRGAYIGLVVGFLFLFLFRARLLLIPLLLAVIYWQVALPQKVQERIKMTTDEYGQLDKSNTGRLVVWQQSLELFNKSPVIGVGYGVFQYLGFNLKDTHNIYLKILAEQGLVGLFIFLLLLFILFFQGLKLLKNSDDDFAKGLGLGFSACILVLMINNLFGDRWTYIEMISYLWIFAGLVARLNISAMENEQTNRIELIT